MLDYKTRTTWENNAVCTTGRTIHQVYNGVRNDTEGLIAWQAILVAARELIKRAGWTQGSLQRHWQTGECLCIMGALNWGSRITENNAGERATGIAQRAIRWAINKREPHWRGLLPSWNDEPGRTPEEIVDVLERALEYNPATDAV